MIKQKLETCHVGPNCVRTPILKFYFLVLLFNLAQGAHVQSCRFFENWISENMPDRQQKVQNHSTLQYSIHYPVCSWLFIETCACIFTPFLHCCGFGPFWTDPDPTIEKNVIQFKIYNRLIFFYRWYIFHGKSRWKILYIKTNNKFYLKHILYGVIKMRGQIGSGSGRQISAWAK